MQEINQIDFTITEEQADLINGFSSICWEKISVRERLEKQKKAVLSFIKKERLNDAIDLSITESIFDNARSCIDHFMNGDLASSIEALSSFYFTGMNYIRYFRLNEENIVGYRIRELEGKRKKYKRQEMFHIPFEKRYMVSNQRFSITGYPCLYIGSSIYGCWKEIKPEKEEKFSVIAIRNTQLVTTLDLRLRKVSAGPFNNKDFYRCIISWFCSYKEHKKDGVFKESYIFPQMMTAALVKTYKRLWSDTGISYALYPRGFIYSSSLSEDITWHNYVFPVESDNEKGLCPILESLFSYTDPVSYPWFKNLVIKDFRNCERNLFCKDASGIKSFTLLEEFLTQCGIVDK